MSLFYLCMNYKFRLKVNKQVTLIKSYLCINFHTPKNVNEEKREHALHICHSHQNPTYSM